MGSLRPRCDPGSLQGKFDEEMNVCQIGVNSSSGTSVFRVIADGMLITFFADPGADCAVCQPTGGYPVQFVSLWITVGLENQ